MLTTVFHSVVSANLVFFTDKPGFDAASTTSLVEDFESTGQSVNTRISPGFSNAGITYTALAGEPSPNVFIADGLTNFGLGPGVPIPSNVLTASGLEDFTLDFSLTITAIGFDTYLNAATVAATAPDTVSVFGVGGLLGVFNPSHAPSVVGYLGIVADEPITSIRWTTVGGDIVNTGIDNISLGTAVPEPSSLILLAVAVLAFGGCEFCKKLWRMS